MSSSPMPRLIMTPTLARAIVMRVQDDLAEDDAGRPRTMPPVERDKLEACIEYLAQQQPVPQPVVISPPPGLLPSWWSRLFR